MKPNGFTIIEMLVVVIVIAILSGLVFKMIGAGGASSDRATAHRQVEALANACEEYRAEYGRYPPVPKFLKWHKDKKKWRYIQPVDYSYPQKPSRWTTGGESGSKTLANLLKGKSHTEIEETGAYAFKFGLLSFFVPRIEKHAANSPRELFLKGAQSEQHIWFFQNNPDATEITKEKAKRLQKEESFWGGYRRDGDWETSKNCPLDDNARDIRVAKKVWPLISEVVRTDSDYLPYHDDDWNPAPGYNHNVWTNSHVHVTDPWGNSLNYKSDPPYDCFKVWSNGPDGKTGDIVGSDNKTRNYSADDIVAGNEN